MKKLVLASVIVLCGSCGVASAQSVEVPSSPPRAADAAERGTPRSGEQPVAPRPNDPDTTGDDKINGLEVPQMKGGGGRDR